MSIKKLYTTDLNGFFNVTNYEEWQTAKDAGQIKVHIKLLGTEKTKPVDEVCTLAKAYEHLLNLPA